MSASDQKFYEYTIDEIKSEISSTALGYYGSMGPARHEMTRIENEIKNLDYDEVKKRQTYGYSPGLYESLWAMDKHKTLFGEDTKIKLPQKLETYLDDVYDHDYSIEKLASALKTALDGRIEEKRQQEMAAQRQERNTRQNEQRGNFRRFVKRPPPGPKGHRPS
ncbi:MAG: hypothetical protein EA357_05570 [Micavibrio sp.]|nr:MAG: hypothetical protein EA357_05570 [Micavibrio sp.]